MARYSSHSSKSVTPGRRSSWWIAVQSGSALWRMPGLEPYSDANSSASRPPSVSVAGNGQVSPTTITRARQSCTVLRVTPTATAIARTEVPHSYLNCRISRTGRIDTLLAGIGPPSRPDETADRSPAQRSGNTTPQGWPTSNRNPRPASPGIRSQRPPHPQRRGKATASDHDTASSFRANQFRDVAGHVVDIDRAAPHWRDFRATFVPFSSGECGHRWAPKPMKETVEFAESSLCVTGLREVSPVCRTTIFEWAGRLQATKCGRRTLFLPRISR